MDTLVLVELVGQDHVAIQFNGLHNGAFIQLHSTHSIASENVAHVTSIIYVMHHLDYCSILLIVILLSNDKSLLVCVITTICYDHCTSLESQVQRL